MSIRHPSLQIYEWIKATQDQHLTLRDVLDLDPGETMDVVCFDGHFEEHRLWQENPFDVFDCEDILQENRIQITYQGNLKWTLHMRWGESFDHPVHVNIVDDVWKPINADGIVYWFCQSCSPTCTQNCGNARDLPPNTRVGWRGPIIRWDDLVGKPKIFHAMSGNIIIAPSHL